MCVGIRVRGLQKSKEATRALAYCFCCPSLWPEKYYILLLSLFISLRSLPTHRLSSKENLVISKVKSLDSFIVVVRLSDSEQPGLGPED